MIQHILNLEKRKKEKKNEKVLPKLVQKENKGKMK